MYESFFRFRHRPFAVLPDADGLFWTEGHRNAFSAIEVGLDRRSQISVLTGGIGTGKTTLIRHLLQTASDAFSVGLLSNFAGQRGDLLPWVLTAFGLNFSGMSDAAMFRRLEGFLARERNYGRRSVLIIDEAQNLSEQDLENLRLLSNLNSDEVLMMLVLVGQPQLRAKMTRSVNRRLCQRIGADYHLEPMTPNETSSYIRHRCERAGGPRDLFDDAACDEVHRITTGVLRKINVLCDLALIAAYADGASSVNASGVRSVIEDARRHGTYTSLTEHEFIRVSERRPVVEGETDQTSTSHDGACRDPLQRLTLILEAGRLGSIRATAPGSAGSSVRDGVGAGVATPLVPAGDLNALLETAWSEDAMLFMGDSTGEDKPAVASGRSDQQPRGDFGPIGRELPPPAPLGGVAVAGALSRASLRNAGPVRSGKAGRVAAKEAGIALCRSGRSDAPRIRGSSAEATEAALRHAFAPREAWRRTGWRGATAVAALAVSGSMAAALAIALLPEASPPPRSEPRMKALWTEANGLAPQLSSRDEAPLARVNAALAGVTDPAPIAGVATEIVAGERASAVPRPGAGPAPAARGSGYSPADLSVASSPIAEGAFVRAGGSAPRMPALPVQDSASLWAAASGESEETALADLVHAERHTVRFGRPAVLTAPAAMPDDDLVPASPYGEESARSHSAPSIEAVAVAADKAFQPAPEIIAAAKPARAPGTGAPVLPPVETAAVQSGLPDTNAAPDPVLGASGELAEPGTQGGAALLPSPKAPGAPDPDAAFRHALDIALHDPRAAVIAYARAALLGHARAAYYLGQIYETGDGVPVDLAIARHWYEVSSLDNERARNRLADLPQPDRSGPVAPPLPLLAEPSGAGHADFVWTSGQGADPDSYVIELGSGLGGATAIHAVAGSAARLPVIEGASRWRVLALDASGRRVASGWRKLPPAASERAAAIDAPSGRL